MPSYKAPLRDINFVLNELLDSDSHYKSLTGCEEINSELLDAIIGSASKFAENVVAPLNRSGDEQGCHFDEGSVTTPQGFKEAFEQYAAGGWQGLSVPREDGGQGLPGSCSALVNELIGSSNYAWSMIGGLAHAPISLLLAAGGDEGCLVPVVLQHPHIVGISRYANTNARIIDDFDRFIRILVSHHLQNQMRGAAKAGKPKRLTVLEPTQLQRPVTNSACTQHRCRLHGTDAVRDPVCHGFIHHHVLCVTAVDIASGGEELRAEVLQP